MLPLNVVSVFWGFVTLVENNYDAARDWLGVRTLLKLMLEDNTELSLVVFEQLVKVVRWHFFDVESVAHSSAWEERKSTGGGVEGDCFCNDAKCISPGLLVCVPLSLWDSKRQLMNTVSSVGPALQGRHVQELIFQVQSQKWLAQVRKKKKSYLPITANIPVCTNYLCFWFYCGVIVCAT